MKGWMAFLTARTVSARIVWTVLALCSLLVFATTAISLSTVRRALEDRLLEQGAFLSTVSAELLAMPMRLDDRAEIDAVAKTLVDRDPDVTELLVSSATEHAPWLDEAPWKDVPLDANGSGSRFHDGALYLLLRVEPPGEEPIGHLGLVLSEARIGSAVTRLNGQLLLAAALLLLLASMPLGRMLHRRVQTPLRDSMAILADLADGDLRHRLPAGGGDEFGRMAHSLNTAIESVAHTIRSITAGSDGLSDAAAALTGVSKALVADAEGTARQAGQVADGGAETSRGVQSVAEATDGLNESIREIATSASRAAGIARSAVDTTEEANRTIERLHDSGARIGNVIKVITTIAEQTNLLALNATIEASRAGDAGRGFSVVAHEVKGLATQTAQATSRIQGQVLALQEDAREAVLAIGRVTEVIGRISTLQTSIAGAVEEQNAASGEIRQSAEASGHIASGITRTAAELVDAAGGTSAAAAETRATADRLAAMASGLRQEVQRFRIEDAPGGGRP